jgi:hypothetical protein
MARGWLYDDDSSALDSSWEKSCASVVTKGFRMRSSAGHVKLRFDGARLQTSTRQHYSRSGLLEKCSARELLEQMRCVTTSLVPVVKLCGSPYASRSTSNRVAGLRGLVNQPAASRYIHKLFK